MEREWLESCGLQCHRDDCILFNVLEIIQEDREIFRPDPHEFIS